MDLKIILNKVIQAQKDKYACPLICGSYLLMLYV